MTHRHHLSSLLVASLALALGACAGDAPQDQITAAGGTAEADAGAWPPAPPTGDDRAPPPDMRASAYAQVPTAGEGGQAPLPQLDTSRLQTVQIVDRNGFAQPMVAAEVEVPAGWQTVGGVSWNDGSNCVANQLQIGWSAIAPDSLTALEILPGFNWQVAGTEIQMNPCPAAPFRSTREFLEATVQKTRPGARVLDYQQLPEVEQKMAQAAQSNPQAQVRHDAGRILIGYAKDGVDMREMLSAAVSFSQMQGNVVAGTATIHSLRAPNGRLDFSLTQRIADTMRPNPQWMEAMKQRSMASLQRFHDGQSRSINDWHNRQMAIINARGMADRHAIRMRTNQEVAGIYSAVAANTSATNDNIHRRTMEGIGEYNSYAGTDGSTVQSSIHGGSRVFQDNTDPSQAYSTNAPYHDPSNATELERIP